MPNVVEMEKRLMSHLARVSGKALNNELDRINALCSAGKISRITAVHMISTAPLRLAYRANVA